MEYRLSEIYIYPFKSLGGISLKRAEVTDRGLKYDRRFMLVDAEGNFLTQRKFPVMALIKPEITDGGFRLKSSMDDSIIEITYKPKTDGRVKVKIWDDVVEAMLVSEEADKWFEEILDVKCRLVFMDDDVKRYVDKKYAVKNELVSFADGFPFLIIGEESLNDLNSRLKVKLPMNRFRPNLVFKGGRPFDEDKWESFVLNGIEFRVVKPCARCVITTVDQANARKSEEPLNTLSLYRKEGNKIFFGQNLLHEGVGLIETDSVITVTQWK
ncbi:Fe-S domain protein [Melioribacter roseus P3M-2]|uniref:Fe-S domain protein n=1 Tax=Melioribacter roseus (strain DSM 23840 / JCM 17771 / VKM B-2668 / P3M-2) TaxID=1191523 RepID=I7A3Q3_MELRP|nr:MOSC N-terminal beta barrel domain-containing protein [Melioribacter roseus]AFN74516.1 Fe-S domain protein [Melioribacter roseus P3M-2]